MISTLLLRLAGLRHDQRGFTMVIVMGVLAVTSVFIAAGFAAADGDMPIVTASKDRKAAYAAAEAGVNFYMFHLAQDPDYWTKCDQVLPPNATEANPVNLAGASPARWRNLPQSAAKYKIEMLPAAGAAKCVPADQKSMLDPATGMFRIRATGQAGKVRRSIIANFRRSTFLDYLYFTDYETSDPLTYSAWLQPYAESQCANKYRAQRSSWCSEIQFIEPDAINGPLHTNDSILTCNRPTFGRDANDVIEVQAAAPGYTKLSNANCSGAEPDFRGQFKSGRERLEMPTSNASIASVAGYTFTGTTTIRLREDHKIDVVKSDGTSATLAWPSPAVIHVKNGTRCGSSSPPTSASYDDPKDCAIVYVSGSYADSLTINTEDDIVIRPPAGSANGDILRKGDAVLGLIAANFVRVYHKVARNYNGDDESVCANVDTVAEPLMKDVKIDAAILALSHSFIVDNYACGAKLGTLTVEGAIAQRYRGPVGTSGGSGGTGYIKSYGYDDRLRYRSPPYFLNPVAASWKIVRTNEQVPAAR
jgi:hypothetical protein